MSSFQPKLNRRTKKQESVTNMQGTQQPMHTDFERTQMLEIVGKHFEASLINMIRELKENVMVMNQQILIREIEIIF